MKYLTINSYNESKGLYRVDFHSEDAINLDWDIDLATLTELFTMADVTEYRCNAIRFYNDNLKERQNASK